MLTIDLAMSNVDADRNSIEWSDCAWRGQRGVGRSVAEPRQQSRQCLCSCGRSSVDKRPPRRPVAATAGVRLISRGADAHSDLAAAGAGSLSPRRGAAERHRAAAKLQRGQLPKRAIARQ